MMTIGKLNARTKETQGGRGPRSGDYSNKSTSRAEQPEEAFHKLFNEWEDCGQIKAIPHIVAELITAKLWFSRFPRHFNRVGRDKLNRGRYPTEKS
jgi:hypothetical protein